MKSNNIYMISSAKEIKYILQKGKHFSGKYLKFIYLNQLDSKLELLISVPKKKIKLAVDRNRIKRRIKEKRQ